VVRSYSIFAAKKDVEGGVEKEDGNFGGEDRLTGGELVIRDEWGSNQGLFVRYESGKRGI